MFDWQKFHSMNASIATDSKSGEIRFYSYETLICTVCGDLLTVGNYFRCSASTRRQFSRFLRENDLPDYLTLKDLEVGMLKESGMYTGEVFDVGGYHVTFANDWRFSCPNRWAFL